MKSKISNLAVWALGSLLLVMLDQYTKSFVTAHLKGQPPTVVINGVFEFLYSENRGAAFGMMQGRQGFFLPDWNSCSGSGGLCDVPYAGLEQQTISFFESLRHYDYSRCNRKYD